MSLNKRKQKKNGVIRIMSPVLYSTTILPKISIYRNVLSSATGGCHLTQGVLIELYWKRSEKNKGGGSYVHTLEKS